MSNVDLAIGGRKFTVACASGEEAHITKLGRTIDAKLAAMGGAAGQSEARMLLFAALLLADEIDEIENRGGKPTPPPAPKIDPKLAERLESLAGTLESCAARLEERAKAS